MLARIKLNPVSGPTTDDFYNVQFAARNGTILINDFAVASKQASRGRVQWAAAASSASTMPRTAGWSATTSAMAT